MQKFIFVLGGSLSSLGKGVLSSSIGTLLEEKSYKISMIKIDPYLNISSGLLNPHEHGETFVLNDGWECDLDLGNYFRFTHSKLNKNNSITTGQIYKEVLENEQKGKYLGKTVQVVPHITEEIKRRIKLVAATDNADLIITELGGTIGDIESIPFVEAIRQLILEFNTDCHNIEIVYLTYIPTLYNGEVKTKPTQQAVKTLQESGIQPNIIVCRANELLQEDMKSKVSLFTNVRTNHIFTSPNLSFTVYELPKSLYDQGLVDIILSDLNLSNTAYNYTKELETNFKNTWGSIGEKYRNFSTQTPIQIAIVGKYIKNPDAYKSVEEALKSASLYLNKPIALNYLNLDNIIFKQFNNDTFSSLLSTFDGFLIPGGFGSRGTEEMINVIQWARENNKPIFGICLGMQLMFIEYCRNVLGLKDANSTEFNPETSYPVVSLLSEQKNLIYMDGTLRLGAITSELTKDNSRIVESYKKFNKFDSNSTWNITEIHRHRYEINASIISEEKLKGVYLGSIFSNHNNLKLMESFEYKNKPMFGVQFHPELQSKIFEPHPLFVTFIKDCIK
jgi:CTP synthase